MKTLQEQYNLLNEGKGHKNVFMKSARNLFPDLFNNFTNYNTAVKVLKDKNIISEAVGGVVTGGNTSPNWFKVFDKNMNVISEEEAKAIEKKTIKSVSDLETAGYDYKDPKNSNNLNFEEMLMGYYAEMKDPKNADKTEGELKEMVAKNLTGDPTYYTTNQAFGIMDIGYTKDAPGLGSPKEIKGEYKGSGYGESTNKDIPEGEVGTGYNYLKEDKMIKLTDLINEAIGGYIDLRPAGQMAPVQEDARTDAEEEGYKDGMRDEKEDLKDKPKTKKIKKETIDTKLSEIGKQGDIVKLEAQINYLDEAIAEKNQRISMVTEDENLSELVDKTKMKEMQRSVKELEKRKMRMEKLYEKLAGESYVKTEIVDETTDESEY